MIFKVSSNPNHYNFIILCHSYDRNEHEKEKGPWSLPFGPILVTWLQTRAPLYQGGLKQVCNSGTCTTVPLAHHEWLGKCSGNWKRRAKGELRTPLKCLGMRQCMTRGPTEASIAGFLQ